MSNKEKQMHCNVQYDGYMSERRRQHFTRHGSGIREICGGEGGTKYIAMKDGRKRLERRIGGEGSPAD